MEPWRLAELNYGQIKGEAPFEVAVLPLGATEPHNLHLPYGTDTFQVEVIASRARRVGARPAGAGGAAAGDPVRDRDQPDAIPDGDEPESLDDGAGDRRPGGLAGGARRHPMPDPQRARRQRPEVGAAGAASIVESAPFPVQLVQDGLGHATRPYSARRTTMPARWRRAWGWRTSRGWSRWSGPTRGRCGRRGSRRSTGAGSRSRVPGTC